jgi:hypothetical protein
VVGFDFGDLVIVLLWAGLGASAACFGETPAFTLGSKGKLQRSLRWSRAGSGWCLVVCVFLCVSGDRVGTCLLLAVVRGPEVEGPVLVWSWEIEV